MGDKIKETIERVVKSEPINRTARNVISRGVHCDLKKIVDQQQWDTPPETVKPPVGTLDLTGMRRGRLRVIGWLNPHTKKSAPWLVRCDCGMYLSRTSSAIKNEANESDCCDKCRALIHLKRARHFENTGEWKTYSEI